MTQRTLKETLLRSFVPLLLSCILVLIVTLIIIVLLQINTGKIVHKRIPITEVASEFVLSIDNCIGNLRSWILTGEDSKRWDKIECESELKKMATSLENAVNDPSIENTKNIKHLLAQLRVSIWYVINISHTPGNNPSRLIYERDLLPIYHNIQNALIGITDLSTNALNEKNIALTIAITHQTLSEAIRKLNNALNSGEVFEIKQFRLQAIAVEKLLEKIKLETQNNPHKANLANWVEREYRIYKQLAERSLDRRQSSDWNKAIYTLRTETEPLATLIRSELENLKIVNSKALGKAANRSVLLTEIVAFTLLVSIVLMGILAFRSSRTIANNLHNKINSLSASASLIGKGEFKPIQLQTDAPVELQSLANDINLSAQKIESTTMELKQVVKALKSYSQVISHDLKTPIINIKGYITILKEIIEPLKKENIHKLDKENIEELHSALNFVDISFVQIQKFISRIIENSRFLSHTIEKKEIHIESLILNTLALFSNIQNKVHLKIPKQLTILSDSFLLEHILINLIDNAIKYSEASRPLTLTISALPINNELVLSLEDNGIGIDASINLTEPFVQGSEKLEGYGLGLALTVSMVEQLGGRLTWSNNANKIGAKFVVHIPI